MQNALCATFLGIFLTACGGIRGQVEEYGAVAFDELEASSVTATKAAKRYICQTARIQAISEVFVTEQQKKGRDMICNKGKKP